MIHIKNLPRYDWKTKEQLLEKKNLKPFLNSTLSSECELSAGTGWNGCSQIVMS